MYKLVFTTNGFEHPHIGYTEGKRWNGWATPYFEVDEAINIMEEFNKCMPEEFITYDEGIDTFIHKIADDETEIWKGKNYQTDEGIKHLYGIGAYSWVWEFITQDDIKSVAQRIEDFLWEFDPYEYNNNYDDREELVREIIAQLQDLKTLKQVLNIFYNFSLTEQELFEALGKELKV